MSVNPSNQMLRAIRSGDLDAVDKLIDKYGLEYSFAWSGGYIFLRKALKNDQTEIAKLLLARGAKVDSDNTNDDTTPLHFAIRDNNFEMVELLLSKNANVEKKDDFGDTPLYCAINGRRTEIIEILLKMRSSVDIRSSDGKTPLHRAAILGDERIAEILLNYGADINSSSFTTIERDFTPLHYACAKGHENFVKFLLLQGADANATTCNGLTALHIAIEKKRENIVKLLFDNPSTDINNRLHTGITIMQIAINNCSLMTIEHIFVSRPDFNSENNRSCLYNAILGRDDEKSRKIIEIILKRDFTILPEDTKNSLLLHDAVKKGYVKFVEIILMNGADVNIVNSIKPDYTLLHNAAMNKQLEIAKILIMKNANANAKDHMNKLPISYAIDNKDINMVKMFLSDGNYTNERNNLLNNALRVKSREIVDIILEYEPDIDINALDDSGQTALYNAVYGNPLCSGLYCGHRAGYCISEDINIRLDLIKLLLARGAKINAPNRDGTNPLHAAVDIISPEIIEILLENKADVNFTSNSGWTPLHCSAGKGHENICKIFLDKGAKIDAKAKDGKTPLYVACQNGHEDVVSTLLKYEAEIDSCDKNGTTALHIAVLGNSLGIVKILLNNFADVESRDEHNKRPLHIASQQGYADIVEILLDYGSDVNVCCNYGRTPLYYAMMRVQRNQNNSLSHQNTASIIKHRIMKTRMLGYSMGKNNTDTIIWGNEEADSTIAGFLEFVFLNVFLVNKCKREVMQMKCTKIKGTNVTYHDLLTKNINRLAAYTRNENIVKSLESCNHDKIFPSYCDMIHNNFKKAQNRESLLNSGFKALDFLSGFLLPTAWSMELLKDFSNKDLRSLVKAGLK